MTTDMYVSHVFCLFSI